MTPAMHDRQRAGAAKTEYIIIIVLVAIALIASVIVYRNTIDNKYSGSSVEVMKLDADAP